MAYRSARTFLASAECYDRQVDWTARLGREIPFLSGVFGPPGELGLLDAGCGTGHHAAAMAAQGYRVTAADVDADMLRFARKVAGDSGARVRFIRAAFGELPRRVRGPFDGLWCVGNSLALASSERAVREALGGFTRLLRPGGRLMIQVTNFTQIRRQAEKGGYVRGPHAITHDGREYVSLKVFYVAGDRATVTGVTLWKDAGQWQRETFQGHLYAIEAAPLTRWLKAAGFRVLERLGSYAGEAYDAEKSGDLVVVAARVK
jgi:glycine/sarcosine N-methyltransferase